VFFCRKGYDSIREQFIELAFVIQIIRVQSDGQSRAQSDLLLREVFHRSWGFTWILARSGDGKPPGQIDPVLFHDLQQPVVLDLPEGLVRLILDQESEVREQLAEAHVG
jgi:hypothetical protein